MRMIISLTACCLVLISSGFVFAQDRQAMDRLMEDFTAVSGDLMENIRNLGASTCPHRKEPVACSLEFSALMLSVVNARMSMAIARTSAVTGNRAGMDMQSREARRDLMRLSARLEELAAKYNNNNK